MTDKSFLFKCSCGCGILQFNFWEDEYQELFISYYASSFYVHQDGLKDIIWNRIKGAWKMLLGKEYLLYDVCIHKNELQDFKDFVKEL
jgi:hypothetical protein